MAGRCKQFVPTTLKLRADLAERLDQCRSETGASKTFVIEKALDEYFMRRDGADNKKGSDAGNA